MKKFKKVKVGDIGFDYHGDQVEVLEKIHKSAVCDKDYVSTNYKGEHFSIEVEDYTANRSWILAKDIVHGDIDFYVYGDDGVYVPKNSEVSKFILEENETEFLVESIQFILDNCNNVIKTSNNDYTFNRDKVENLKVRLMEFGNMYEE